MNIFNYQCRLTAFKTATTYQLDDNALHWQDEKGESGTLALRDITSLYLKHEPTRFAQDRYLARIEAPGQSITLSNLSFVGFADFRPDDHAYRDFIIALARRIAIQSPSAEMRGGDKALTYRIYQVISIAVLLLLLGVAWLLYTIDLPEIIGLKVLLLLYYLPKMKAYMDANKPAQLDPLHLPELLLPEV